MKNILLLIAVVLTIFSCSKRNEAKKVFDEDQLGIIEADVRSVETNLKNRPEYSSSMPGSGERIDRSFENAPPMIPHTTDGFFPITIKNNICLSCHMPDKVKESKAIPLPETHFTRLRPELELKDGKYDMTDSSKVTLKLGDFNKAYFNCSQCHVPQSNVSVNIENLFTPEFRAKNGLKQSNLKDKLKEGVN